MKHQSGCFTKGTSGNPSGRPKGSVEDKTAASRALIKGMKFSSIRKSLSILDKALEEGEPWAVELYVQEIIPKSTLLNVKIDKCNPNKQDAIIEAIYDGLSDVKLLNVKDACLLLNQLVG